MTMRNYKSEKNSQLNSPVNSQKYSPKIGGLYKFPKINFQQKNIRFEEEINPTDSMLYLNDIKKDKKDEKLFPARYSKLHKRSYL